MSELQKAPKHKVRVSLSWKGSRNFQSTGVDISLEVEGEPGETPGQTFDKAFSFVERKMQEKVTEAIADLDSAK